MMELLDGQLTMAGINQNKDLSAERGATIIVVTICLAALVGMAALAIDIASLYVARGEAQRAADAAALAGASIFVRSGITSVSGMDQTAICQSAQAAAAAIAAKNSIAGQTPTITSSCAFDTADLPENPRITVKVQSGTLPTFFAKIWGGAASTATATVTAEAYNQSGSNTPPVLLTSVKPWLIPNCDPASSALPCASGYFVNSDGTLTKNNFIGQTIQLNSVSGDIGQTGGNGAGALTFYPLNFTNITPSPNLLCPSTGIVPSCSPVRTINNYFNDIACSVQISSQVAMQCGQQIGFGQSVRVQTGGTIDSDTINGASCLIHQGSDGTGQDLISASLGAPATITGGENNPDTDLNGITNISRSDSIVTVPLYDGRALCISGRFGPSCRTAVPVLGFLQLGILQANTSGTPQLNAVIVNAVGCNASAIPSATGITSNAAIPVRLVRNP